MLFLGRFERWTFDEIKLQVEQENLQLIRLAWADPHGCSRVKEVTVPVFFEALTNGYNINVATSTLDSAGGRVFSSFERGGGFNLDEMTGSPDLTIRPDLETFRVLPWAPGIGWILCDEYFRDGTPFHFSPRHVLRKQIERLDKIGMKCIIGLEIEWYLNRLVEPNLTNENVGFPGTRGKPLQTAPLEPGYSYHSETNLDLMQPVLSELAATYEKLGLSLRSIENEWGPSQVECTFSPQDALMAADDFVLFRTATRQVCRRMGYFATFMCRPKLQGYYASGWHLHSSIVDCASGNNIFTPQTDGDFLSKRGKSYLAGVIEHANPASVFTTPTVNGYRRFQPNSLAPDRAAWGFDHRGAMLRVLGGVGNPATRLENRAGEPAANPYLFIASQIASGLDGMERELDPGPPEDEPYAAECPMLPTTLASALDALDGSQLFRRDFGDLFINYLIKLKNSEVSRFNLYRTENKIGPASNDVTEWEQNEYFDFF